MNQNQRHTGPTGRKIPLTNAQRQARFRERRRLLENPPPDDLTLDLFGGVSPSVTVAPVHSVTPAVTPVQVEPVTPVTPVQAEPVTPVTHSVTHSVTPSVTPDQAEPVTPELRVDSSMLSPCPFCGGEAFFEDHGSGLGCAFCSSCKCRTRPTFDRARTVADWNRRV